MIMTGIPGTVIGRPGGSLVDASWAKNTAVADIGRGGEQRTAAVLNDLARVPGGPTVLHDLRIPIPGFSANIDHVVVAGSRVTIIDSKVWRHGVYWTLSGRTRRGLAVVDFADKKTLPTAHAALRRHLDARMTWDTVFGPNILAVWPSGDGPLSTFAYRPQDAIVVHGKALRRRLPRLTGATPADPVIVQILSQLVNGVDA